MLEIKPPPGGHYDEMLVTGSDASSAAATTRRPHDAAYCDWLRATPEQSLAARRAQADLLFRRIGIAFTVYGDDAGIARLIPSCVIPRIIPAAEWALLEHGLKQRVTAINRFLADIDHEQATARWPHSARADRRQRAVPDRDARCQGAA